jgi:hypothetical protein
MQDRREREVDSTHILTENVLLQFSISFLTLILFEIYEIKNVFQALEKLQINYSQLIYMFLLYLVDCYTFKGNILNLIIGSR